MTNNRPVALVTGASSGIGQAAAHALSSAGYAVVGTSRNAATSTPIEGVEFLDLDVSSDESVGGVVAQMIERFGRVDLLVNKIGRAHV
jgi:NAD(P)-dependent dehydrogenase (short-subunit alcohol dehydrogenase family)